MVQSSSTRSAGDILDLLRRDHIRIDHLLDQIEETDESEERRRGQLFAQVAAEIEVHSDTEDQVVYSTLEGRAGFEDFIDRARDQHERIEQLVDELDQVESASGDWMGRVAELRELVRQHVDQEEGRLFPMIRDALDAAARAGLAEEFVTAKESEQQDELSGEFLIDPPPGTNGRKPFDTESSPAPGREELESLSKKELYELARSRHIDGRSAMTKAELVVAIRTAAK